MLSQLAAMLGLSPDVVTLILAVLPIVAGVLHSRGNRLPLLSAIIDALTGTKTPTPTATPVDPNAPAVPHIGDGHILKGILARLDQAEAKLGIVPTTPAAPTN